MNDTPTIDDGGPAFARAAIPTNWSDKQNGMSLRDYFAAAALTGIIASYGNTENIASVESSAKEAFARADAMLAARNNSGGTP